VLIAGYFGFPKLGIIAPAIATITGNALVILFLIIYLNKNHPLKPDLALLKHIRYDAELTRLILRLGIPTGIQMVTTSVAGLVVVG
jgi:Na+-driven multidrug efflux pump